MRCRAGASCARDGAVRELGVSRRRRRATSLRARRPADAALAQACAALFAGSCRRRLPDGYVSEVCLRGEPWIASLAAMPGHGALLLFDYGLHARHYYHPQRASGTLRCHFKQRAHDDPYINVGVQDITAWVDFTRVAEAGDAAASRWPASPPRRRSAGRGLEQLVGAAEDDLERARLAGEARRLLMPEEMGEAFKVMALTRACDEPLGGFALQDLRHLL